MGSKNAKEMRSDSVTIVKTAGIPVKVEPSDPGPEIPAPRATRTEKEDDSDADSSDDMSRSTPPTTKMRQRTRAKASVAKGESANTPIDRGVNEPPRSGYISQPDTGVNPPNGWSSDEEETTTEESHPPKTHKVLVLHRLPDEDIGPYTKLSSIITLRGDLDNLEELVALVRSGLPVSIIFEPAIRTTRPGSSIPNDNVDVKLAIQWQDTWQQFPDFALQTNDDVREGIAMMVQRGIGVDFIVARWSQTNPDKDNTSRSIDKIQGSRKRKRTSDEASEQGDNEADEQQHESSSSEDGNAEVEVPTRRPTKKPQLKSTTRTGPILTALTGRLAVKQQKEAMKKAGSKRK